MSSSSSSFPTTTLLQISSISLSLLAAGGIATLSLFDVPVLQAQPASRALPSLRWLFSRGSHVFPAVAVLTASGFGALAVRAQQTTTTTTTTNGYAAAGVLCLAIAPFTSYYMVPNNFAFIQMNADKGGARSEKAARATAGAGAARPGRRTAEDSVRGEGEGDEFTDLSGPQGQTRDSSTREEDDEVRQRLTVFGRQNMVRAVLMAAGGIVGLVTALL